MKEYKVKIYFRGHKEYRVESANKDMAIEHAQRAFNSESRDDLKGAFLHRIGGMYCEEVEN